jgi:hypothetical protein
VKLTTPIDLVPWLIMVELYLHSAICLHDIVPNYVVEYRNNFTLLLRVNPISSSIYLGLYRPFVGSWSIFGFLILHTVGRTLWTGDQPVARPLPTHRATQTQNKCTQIFMPRGGFEPTIPVFKQAKIVHALDRAAGHCDRHQRTTYNS